MMTSFARAASSTDALSTRLSCLAPLDAPEVRLLAEASQKRRTWPARREIIHEGDPIREHQALLSGWACRQRILSDGRRQILTFLLPGDLMNVCHHGSPLAATTVLAIQDLITCPLPDAVPSSPLAEAYARSAALDQHYLYAQVARLGRFNAYERVADWLLETSDRLEQVGLSSGHRFALPITQELLADALGLTSVHVNRTLQHLRRDGVLELRSGTVTLPDRIRLEKVVDYKRARVSADG